MSSKRRPTGIKFQVSYSDEIDDAICLTVVVEGSGLPKIQCRVPLRDAEEISENLWDAVTAKKNDRKGARANGKPTTTP